MSLRLCSPNREDAFLSPRSRWLNLSNVDVQTDGTQITGSFGNSTILGKTGFIATKMTSEVFCIQISKYGRSTDCWDQFEMFN